MFPSYEPLTYLLKHQQLFTFSKVKKKEFISSAIWFESGVYGYSAGLFTATCKSGGGEESYKAGALQDPSDFSTIHWCRWLGC